MEGTMFAIMYKQKCKSISSIKRSVVQRRWVILHILHILHTMLKELNTFKNEYATAVKPEEAVTAKVLNHFNSSFLKVKLLSSKNHLHIITGARYYLLCKIVNGVITTAFPIKETWDFFAKASKSINYLVNNIGAYIIYIAHIFPNNERKIIGANGLIVRKQ